MLRRGTATGFAHEVEVDDTDASTTGGTLVSGVVELAIGESESVEVTNRFLDAHMSILNVVETVTGGANSVACAGIAVGVIELEQDDNEVGVTNTFLALQGAGQVIGVLPASNPCALDLDSCSCLALPRRRRRRDELIG